MMQIIFIVNLFLTVHLTPQQNRLFGSWKLIELNSNGTRMNDIPVDIAITFLPDGRVMVSLNEEEKPARWRVEGGDLLIIADNAKPERYHYYIQGTQLVMQRENETLVMERTGG